MNVSSARMARPDARLILNRHRCRCRWVVLLNTQIPDGVTRLFQCAEELRLVVLQSLPPLGVTGTDGQNTSMQ